MIKLNKLEYWFIIVFVPIMNAITPLIIETNTDGAGFHAGYIRIGILLAFILFFLIKRLVLTRVLVFIIIFSAYLLTLVLFSTNTQVSLRGFISVFVTLMALPIGYFYIKTRNDIKRLTISYMVSAAIITGYLVYVNIIGLGPSHYLAETFYTGNVTVNITKSLVVIIMTTPIILLLANKSKLFILPIVLLSIIFIIIGLKRSALLASILGIVIYFFLAPKKLYFMKVAGIAAMIIAVFSGFFWDTFSSRWEAREQAIESATNIRETYEEREDRLGELMDVTELVLKKGPTAALFGVNLFIHTGVLENRAPTRVLHVDYSVFLYGSGFIGLFLFLYIYYIAHKEKNRFYKYVKDIRLMQELNAVFYSLIIVALLLSIAGSWGTVGLRTYILLYLGAIIGVIKKTAEIRVKENSFEVSKKKHKLINPAS